LTSFDIAILDAGLDIASVCALRVAGRAARRTAKTTKEEFAKRF